MTKTTRSKMRHPDERRTFEDAMRAQIQRQVQNAREAQLAVPPVLLLIGAGLGAVLGLLPSPIGSMLQCGVAGLIMLCTMIAVKTAYHRDPVDRVDWTTADDYERQALEDRPAVARAILAAAQRKVLARSPAAEQTHLYIMGPDAAHEQTCTVDSGGCKCALLRLTAALRPNRRRPMLIIGERLLDSPDLLQFVLTHEAHHARAVSRTMHMLLGVPLLAGLLALGLVVPPGELVVLAPSVWLVAMALRWGDELLADVIAIRAVGSGAALEYWARVRAACRRPSGARWLLVPLLVLLVPHPPFAVRSGLARLVRQSTR